MSRTPIRQALWSLRAEGLVVIVPAKGAFVSQIVLRDVAEAFQLREGRRVLGGEVNGARAAMARGLLRSVTKTDPGGRNGMRMGTGESPGDKRRPTSERGGPLILLIEDDAWIRAFMRDAITDAGYRVIEAADGRTGMRLASEQPPDLVLLDLAMPGITGVDVLHELKRQATTQNVSVVVLSAFPQVLSERDACSVAGVLAKPVDVTTLLERIHDAVPNETVDDSTGAAPHRGVPCSA